VVLWEFVTVMVSDDPKVSAKYLYQTPTESTPLRQLRKNIHPLPSVAESSLLRNVCVAFAYAATMTVCPATKPLADTAVVVPPVIFLTQVNEPMTVFVQV
jgi:hypothetical protein